MNTKELKARLDSWINNTREMPINAVLQDVLRDCKAALERLQAEITELKAFKRLYLKQLEYELERLSAETLRAENKVLREALEKVRGYGRGDLGHQQMCDYVTEVATEALQCR